MQTKIPKAILSRLRTAIAARAPGFKARAWQYALLMRLNKPIGIFLLLWPTLWALWIAGKGKPDVWVVTVFVLGVVLMRSAGCVINDYADRDIDRHVARTRDRPITAGKVAPKEALILFAVLCLLAFALVLTLNPLTVKLSFAGALLAVTYPFAKRYTYLPQVHLGAAFGWAVPMAYAAQTGAVPATGWLLFIAALLWATVYDTMYAMVDREDDMKIGVKSTAILFGELDRLIIGLLQLTFFIVLILAGRQAHLGLFYYLGVALAAGFALYHHYLIQTREPALCFKAFLNNNWLGFAVFAGIALHYWQGGSS
ncbi:MAG: 4-hydroxybenzoate octaprenyltransferase [Gammaproteobacteria bacterium]|nr:MAG: 4-hydroxybenzoate octaprenyltransferase [Gammaproteobacteria bacterium]